MNISDDLQKVINKAKSSEEFKKKQKSALPTKPKRSMRSRKPNDKEKSADKKGKSEKAKDTSNDNQLEKMSCQNMGNQNQSSMLSVMQHTATFGGSLGLS